MPLFQLMPHESERLLCVFLLSRPETARIIYRIMYFFSVPIVFRSPDHSVPRQFRSPHRHSMAFLWSRCGLTESLILKPERGGRARSTNGNCTRLLTGIPLSSGPCPIPVTESRIRIHSLAAQAAQPRPLPVPAANFSHRGT